MTNFRLFQKEKFADNNYQFEENGGKFSKKGRKHCGESRHCSLRALSFFPTEFSKELYCRHTKPRLIWKRVKHNSNVLRRSYNDHIYTVTNWVRNSKVKKLLKFHVLSICSSRHVLKSHTLSPTIVCK